jgi:hypothetical protein
MSDDLSERLHGYLQRRDDRARIPSIAWPRVARRSIARTVAIATVVGVFVASSIVAGFIVLGPRSGVQSPSSRGTTGTPPERSDAAIAYDPETGQAVMFGGLGANGSLGDTWIWSGTGWTEVQLSPSPLSRFDASMVYDPKLHGLVLFGGSPDQPISASQQSNLGATWLWTGTRWQRIEIPHQPTSNNLSGIGVVGMMAYDAATGRVLLLTSATGPHSFACSEETWAFDGSDWHAADPANPLPAAVAAVVQEPKTGHVIAVLHARAAVAPAGFAGTTCAAGSPAARVLPSSSTWRWTGSNWIEVSAGTEPEGSDLALAANGTSVGLGAVSGASMVVTDNNEELWSWNGSRWTEVPGSQQGPPARTDSMQGIDSEGRVVLFGGINQRANAFASDTWIWNGTRWQQAMGPPPEPSTPSPVSFTVGP